MAARRPMHESRTRSDWNAIAFAIAAGMTAGFQIGKVPPLLPSITADLGLSMVGAGWVVSIFNLVGATCAIAASVVVGKTGARRMIIASLALMTAGALCGALATAPAWLLSARALAGFGLVGIAVSAPRFIVQAAAGPDHARALGLWSTYIPAGVAAGLVVAAHWTEWSGWRELWVADAGLLVLFTLVFTIRTRRVASPPEGGRLVSLESIRMIGSRAGVWWLALCFGCYAHMWFALNTWLPAFLNATAGLPASTGAVITAMVVASNIIGNVGGTWLLHHGIARWGLISVAFATIGCAGTVIFATTFGAGVKITMAILFSSVGGFIPAAILSGTARHAPSPAQVATVNGFVVQGSHLGILLGAPALAMVVSRVGGWHGGAVLVFALSGIGVVLTILLRAAENDLR